MFATAPRRRAAFSAGRWRTPSPPRETHGHRRVNAYLLGLDDATLAALGYDRNVLEDAGRGLMPI